MESSAAESSASHFGVKLRKVASSGSNEKINSTAGITRKSTPSPAGSYSSLNSDSVAGKSSQRRSASALSNQVALRQEIAEKQAIERRKKCSSISSRSWDNKSKPVIPPKPVLKNSSSLGSISKPSGNGGVIRKPIVTRRRSPENGGSPSRSSKAFKEVSKFGNKSESEKSWLDPLYKKYEEVTPLVQSLYHHITKVLEVQVAYAQRMYLEYQADYNKEARKWRNVRLSRRAWHSHNFLAVGLPEPTWCDVCAGVMWGRCVVCLQCVNCKFKCHQTCEDLITEKCSGPQEDGVGDETGQWSTTKHRRHDADDADSGYSGSGSAGFTLTKEEICSKIRAYNESIVGKSSGAMTLISNDSDSFQGCINVCICIDRPINMSLSSRPTSIYEALQRESELSPQTSPKSTVTHEQLPHNAIVSLHTSSSNTAIEVVSILLNKFKITDNPKSFALFEQTIQNDKEVKLRKVGDQERPLLNYLRWSTECDESKRFVLKENDAGDIMYEAFSIPELNNFLRVLEEEEASKLKDIQHKYQVRQKQIADRLDEIEGEQNSSKHLRKTDR